VASLTPEQAAAELSVCKATIMREIHAGNLAAMLIRGTYRIEPHALDAYKKVCQKAAEAGRYKAPTALKSARKPYTKKPGFDPMQRMTDPFKNCG
jgi:excisionase family DNA binding protein